MPLTSPVVRRENCHGTRQEEVNGRSASARHHPQRRHVPNEIFAKSALRRMILSSGVTGLGGTMRYVMRSKTLATTAAAALAAALIGLVGAVPAGADVKAGVDAWSRGDYRKAVEIWRVDANAGDADAEFNMGQAYRLGRGVPGDLPIAEAWFRKAALQGHVEAITIYGLTLFDEGKRGEAVPWLEKSVARGEPRAQMVLGTMLFNGDGVEKNWPRAYALLVRSAASGLPRAAQVQAQMDEYIPRDQRQQGLVMAREYEAAAQRPELPPEIAGAGANGGVRGTELPASSYDQSAGQQPAPVPSGHGGDTGAASDAVGSADRSACPARGRGSGAWRLVANPARRLSRREQCAQSVAQDREPRRGAGVAGIVPQEGAADAVAGRAAGIGRGGSAGVRGDQGGDPGH